MIRQEVLNTELELEEWLGQIGNELDETTMIDLNRRVDFAELRQLMHETSANEQAWLSQTHDLSDFIGKEVLLYIQVYGDGDGLPSAMYLDKVRWQVCE